MGLSHAPINLTAYKDVQKEKVANMTFRELNDSNSFQVNGINVEIMLPDTVALAIPENKPSAISPVKLVVQITNNTLELFSISFNDTFIPELVNSDGQTLQGIPVIYKQDISNRSNISQQQNWRFKLRYLFSRLVNFNRRKYPISVNSWLVQPGSKSSSHLNGRLFWQNDLLILELPTKDYSLDFEYFRPRTYYSFKRLQPGNYQLRFIYFNKFSIYNNELDAIEVRNLPQMASSHPTAAFVNVRLIQPVEPNSIAVEVDGIRFETLMPERVLRLPRIKRDAIVSMQLGIRITNNTQEPLRFSCFFATLIPEIVGANGQILERSGGNDAVKVPKESDFPLTMPGESIELFPEARLLWHKLDKITLHIGGYWWFVELKLATYQIRFRYEEFRETREWIERRRESIEQMRSEKVWSGRVDIPFAEFQLT